MPRGGPASSVLLIIDDTGIGISHEQIERLFQPFWQADESTTYQFGSSRLSAEDWRMADNICKSLGPSADRPGATGWDLAGRVLLVDDGPDNRVLISMHLRRAGLEVTVAENGRVGVDAALAAAAESRPFDLILMDMQMPELDGYGAARELRRRGQTLPIIALTALALAEDRDKSLAAGCTAYMTKPVDSNALLSVISSHLPRKAGPENLLRSSFAVDPDMTEVLDEFVTRLPERVEELGRFLAAGDLDGLRRAVHQLKGAGGGYGFPQITDAAALAEKRVKANEAIASVAQGVHSLIQLIRSVEGYDKSRENSCAAEGPGH